MSETIKIVIKDKYGESCLNDSNRRDKMKTSKPSGFVEIYEVKDNDEKKLLGKSNLVVYQGREWLISSAFQIDNANIDPKSDEFICWFGLGDGGCVEGDPLDPIPPTNLDTELNSRIPINLTNTSYGDFVTGEGYYKMPLTSVTYLTDDDNSSKYLIASVSVNLGVDDANGYSLSEAGLYTAASSAAGYSGDFHLYAKMTFESIAKTASRHLVFVWYVYF